MGRLKNLRSIDEGLCRAVRICCVGSVAAYKELMSPTTNLIINGGPETMMITQSVCPIEAEKGL